MGQINLTSTKPPFGGFVLEFQLIMMKRKINRKLADEILKRVAADQKMRRNAIAGKRAWDDKIDRRNTLWLKKIIKKYGWPTISLVGKRASEGAWLLAQHADHDLRLQKKALRLMMEVFEADKSNLLGSRIAFLTDRIQIHQKKKQIFGTQFTLNDKTLKLEPRPIEDPKSVDKRRKKIGLQSLGAYSRYMNKKYLSSALKAR